MDIIDGATVRQYINVPTHRLHVPYRVIRDETKHKDILMVIKS